MATVKCIGNRACVPFWTTYIRTTKIHAFEARKRRRKETTRKEIKTESTKTAGY
jgi:hypothetical protein